MSATGSKHEALFSVPAESYGPEHRAHLLAQYSLFVETAQKVAESRNAANNYFITVNSALAALYGLLPMVGAASLWRYSVPVAGVLVCVAWRLLISSYRNLNTAKFTVIHELESRLPVALFRYEWQLLEEGRTRKYRPVSHIEGWIPVAFGLLHAGLALALWLTPVSNVDRSQEESSSVQATADIGASGAAAKAVSDSAGSGSAR